MSFDLGDGLDVRSRSSIYRDILSVRDPSNPSLWYWIDASDGKVTPVAGSDCGTLPIDSDPASTYAIRIVSDGAQSRSWTSFERTEIVAGIKEIGDAFARISKIQPSTSVAAFNRVFTSVSNTYPAFVLLVRGESVSDSPRRSPLPAELKSCNDPNKGDTRVDGNDYCIPDLTVTFDDGNKLEVGYYIDINLGNCKAFEAQQIQVYDPSAPSQLPITVPMPSAILCNGALLNGLPSMVNTFQPVSPIIGEASEHTIAHEFGHVFEYLTSNGLGVIEDTIDGGGGSGTIGGSSFALGACASITTLNSPSTVMGVLPGQEWIRGSRGWGSATDFSRFLQTLDEGSPSEAAADMFLNWVYRTNRYDPTRHNPSQNIYTEIQNYRTDGEFAPGNGCVPLADQPILGHLNESWTDGGFYNRKASGNTDINTAPFDWGLSGNIRHKLMNDIMNSIFTQRTW